MVALSGGNTLVWRAAGNGRFTTHQVAPLLPTNVNQIALADLDGDGDRDLIALRQADSFQNTYTNGEPWVLWNAGNGTFQSYVALPVDPASIVTSVATGDVDGDGDVDLLFGCLPAAYLYQGIFYYLHGENWLLLNDGTGTFTAANARLGNDRDYTTAVLLADFDADGDLDIHAANSGVSRHYRNSGTGFFVRDDTALPAMPVAAVSAHAVDVDADGDVDILRNAGSQAVLLRNDGTGHFTLTAASAPNGLPTANQLFVADLDRDGDQDLLERRGVSLVQWHNDGSGAFLPAPSATRTVDQSGLATTFDIEGDGDVDVAVAVFNETLVLQNDGTGAFTTVPAELPPSLRNHTCTAAVDFDRDGDLDVLATGDSTTNVAYRNEGGGRFVAVTAGAFTTATGGIKLAVGDLDGDGWSDTVVASAISVSAPSSRIYRNDGAGGLQAISFPVVDAWDVALGDLDGDGDLDAYLGRAAGALGGANGADMVWRNLGSMNFVPVANAVTDGSASQAVTLADFDGDGDLDVALGGDSFPTPTPLRVLTNDGTGRFTAAPTQLPQANAACNDLVAADVDGDGDQDLIAALNAPPNRLYRNDGTGSFTLDAQALPSSTVRTTSVTAADFDADGDVDLLLTDWYGGPSLALANDGLGHFTVVPGGLPLTPTTAQHFAVGDFDGDEDLDAFLGCQGAAHLYVNHRQQVYWRELPRIASPLTMVLQGTPNETFVLGLAAATAQQPIAGLGTLWLDLQTLLAFDVGSLDGAGQATRSTTVPNEPALVGASFWWQALHGSPLRFGNLERTQLSPH